MKKFLIWGAIALAALVVVGGIVLTLALDKAVVAGVNTFGPQFTGTRVELKEASISAFTGSGEIRGFEIGNPEGWEGAKLMSLGRAKLSVAPLSVLGDTIHIREVIVEGAEFHYQTKLLSSNLGDLLKNIEKAAGGSAEGGKPAEPAASSPGKKLMIGKIVFKDAKVTLGLAGASLPVPVPDLELDEVGTKEGGLTPAQLTLQVGQKVLTHVITSAVKAIANLETTKGVEALKGAARSAGEGLKKLFGGGKSEEKPEEPKP